MSRLTGDGTAELVSRDQILSANADREIINFPCSYYDPIDNMSIHPLSSIPANGIFLTEKLKNENKNAQRVEND